MKVAALSRSNSPGTFIGIDGCASGWIVATFRGLALNVTYAKRLEDIDLEGVAAVGLDMPIGLVSHGKRPADVEAKAFLGRRSSTIFLAPVAAALEAPDFASANALNREHGGFGLSRQAFGLFAKIREVRDWAASTSVPTYEIHPEMAFMDMLGTRELPSKKTWQGHEERRRVLNLVGCEDVTVSEQAGTRAASDDVLDAIAVAWVVREIVAGRGVSIPTTPTRDERGLTAALWRRSMPENGHC